MSTARENLARHLGEASKLAVEQDAPDYWAFIARELVQVGYRPTARTVSTVEELRALPYGSVILDNDGHAWQLNPVGGDPDEDPREWLYVLDGGYDADGMEIVGHDDDWFSIADWHHPLTLIHEGGA